MCAAGIAVVLSTSYARTALAGWALSALEQRFGIVGHAERLELDLSRLDVRVRDLTLATRDQPDQPFFTVDVARVDLPWSALWGQLSVQAIQLLRPRASVVVAADGSSNLPTTGASEPPSGGQLEELPIGELTLRELTVDWRDDAEGIHVAVGPTTATLTGTGTGIAGPVQVDGDVSLEVGGEQIAITRAEGQLAFDGSSLGVEQLVIEAREGTISLDGSVDDLLTTPQLDLAFDAQLDLAQVALRAASEATGALALSGEVSGPVRDVVGSADLTSQALRWNTLTLTDVDGRVRVTSANAVVDMLNARVAGGAATARGTLVWSESGESAFQVTWRRIDADALLTMAPWTMPAQVGTSMTGELDATWVGLEPRAMTVSARTSSRDADRVGATRLDGRNGRWQLDVDLPFADVARMTGTVEGHAVGESWGDLELDGTVSVSCGDLARCRDAIATLETDGPIVGTLAGSVDAELQIGGSLRDPTARGSLTAGDLAIAGLTAVELTAQADMSSATLDLVRFEARQAGNSVRGRGRVAWETGAIEATIDGELDEPGALGAFLPAAWTPQGSIRVAATIGGRGTSPVFDRIAVTGSQLRITPVFPDTPDEIPVTGRLDLGFEVSGPIDDLRGRGHLEAADVSWADYRVGPVEAILEIAGSTLRGQAEAPELAAVADLTLDLGVDRRLDGTLHITDGDLARLTAEVLPLTGRTSLDVSVSHTLDEGDIPEVDIFIGRLDGALADVPVTLVQPGGLQYRETEIVADRLEFVIGTTQASVAGRLTRGTDDSLAARVSGRAEDLAPLLTVVPGAESWASNLTIGGPLELDLTVAGDPETLQLSGDIRLNGGHVTLGDHPRLDQVALQAAYRDGILQLETLAGTWQGTSLTATGSFPADLVADRLPALIAPADQALGPATLRAEIQAITPAALAGYLDTSTLAELEGELSAVVDMEADGARLDAVRGTITVPQGAITIAGVSLEQRRETRFEIADGQVRVGAFDWGNNEDYVTVGGVIDLDDPEADLTVTAELDLRAVSAFTTGTGTDGHGLLIANVQGALTDPTINGTVELTDVGLRMVEPRLIVSGLNGALFLTRDVAQIYELVGEANGGTLEIQGELELDGLQPRGEIVLVGRGIALEIPEGLRTEVNTDLALTVSPDQLALGGTIMVQRGAYREPLTLTGGLFAALREQEEVTVIGIEDETPLDAIGLNVHIVTTEDIVIDNNYADAVVGVDLRVIGTVGAPALTGRLALDEGGELRLGNRVYELERGTIDFIDPTSIEPELDILARTRVSGHDITVTIAGVRDALSTSFQSDPPESESDIVSLLLTGRTLDEVGVAPGAAARDQALGLISGEFLGTAGRVVGLDTVRLEEEVGAGEIRFDSSLVATETNPGTRLTIGKTLSDQVQLIASQNLRESGLLTWIVEYLPRRNIELRLVIDDETDRAYEFRHAVSLGSPPRYLQTPAPRQQTQVVSAVQLAGQVGLPEKELRGRLRLKAGDRFDFYRWQRDRDTLEQLYADLGYLEARIRPRRVEHPDGTLTLVHEVVRGPRTILTVKGYGLPEDVTAAMRGAWREAVFDEFLLEELGVLARAHLVAEGFIQVSIGADIKEIRDQNEKEVVLQIATGPRSSARRIEFRGNEWISTERLQAFVTQQAVDEIGWADAQPMARALLSLYQAEGMLEAEVVIGEPQFDATIATLLVNISEGPVFRIADVALQGVEALPLSAVQTLVSPQAGDVYSGAAISNARARVDRHYRQAGFNEVRVAARSAVDRVGDSVSVVLDVQEGPRQIVHEVEFVGRTRTNERLVSRALQIAPGQPVDGGQWNQARKRLYDTGAFRSVDIAAEPLDPSAAAAERGEQPVRARVLLEESPAYRLRYGVQLNDEEAPLSEQGKRDWNLGFVGDLTHQNFIGRAITLGTAFRWDTDDRILRGFARVPSFFGLPITSNVFLAREHQTFGSPDSRDVNDLTRITLEQRFRPRSAMTVAYSYNFDRSHVFPEDFDPDDPLVFDITTDIARFGTSVVIDTRDDVFDARSGWFHSSSFEYAIDSLGSDLRFAKYIGQQFHYWQLGSGVVLASAGRIGLAAGFDQNLILTERFFAGGGNTVRGYRQDSLGPLFLGEPDGGDAFLVLNQEVRFPILGMFHGVGFIDAGNVFPRMGDLSFLDLKVGTGVGLRIDTPFGLFRFDFAAPLSGIDEDRKSRFFFSIGQVF